MGGDNALLAHLNFPSPHYSHLCCLSDRSPYDQFDAIAIFILVAIFSLDIIINFHLAYPEPMERRLVTNPCKIRMRYLR